MRSELKPIRSEADYERSLAEVERLWGARSGTPEGDRLDEPDLAWPLAVSPPQPEDIGHQQGAACE